MSDEMVQGQAELEDTASASHANADTAPAETSAPTQPASAEVAPPAEADEFEKAMQDLDMGAQYAQSFRQLQEGDVIDGVVMRVDREGVLVDVGAKSEGIIPPEELSREVGVNPDDIVTVGETIRVYVLKPENQDGNPILSKKRADFEKAWIRVENARVSGEVIIATVQERVKGGLTVDLGIRGFVPASHVGNGNLKNNLDRYVAQSIPLKVIEVDRERRKVILSHKLAIQEEREQRSAETKSSLAPEQIRRGVVRRLVPYGAFVDLGGVDGLLHISEMSWTRINDPKEVLKEGQELDVMVLSVDLDKDRVSLGLRQILPDPWAEIPDRYKTGDTITGKVTRVVAAGAFVLVEGGVEAIIPTMEFPRKPGGKGTIPPNAGDDVEVKVIELRPEERRMKLSLRALQPPEENAPAPAADGSAPAGGAAQKTENTTTGSGGRGRGRERERERDDYSRYMTDEEPRFTIGEAFAAAAQSKSKRREKRRQTEEIEEYIDDETLQDEALVEVVAAEDVIASEATPEEGS